MATEHAPFHSGELEAQRRAGAGDVASWAGSLIRNHMPEQHREFFSALPFLVVAGGDSARRPWVTILEGPEGFIRAPARRRLTVLATPHPQDPLAGSLGPGDAIGILGIELATRRRNRLNGIVDAVDEGLAIEVRQSFGNCPQYIRERNWEWEHIEYIPPAERSQRLTTDQLARIAAADTFFIGSGSSSDKGRPSDGFDASHRGGPSGFVRVTEYGTLRIPDYAGNKFFNTLGNLLRDPRVGLLFVDFATGGLLHITGRARIDWAPTGGHDASALRMIEVTVDEVIDRPGALSLRWKADRSGRRRLKVVDKVLESDQIVSFHLAAADGRALAPFRAGQHLPVELEVPGRPDRVRRSYSLSGAPGAETYRLSVKREDRGLASAFLHDRIGIGDMIETGPPSGEFTVPGSSRPLVLVSAGVGITPMLAILHEVTANTPDRPVRFVHSARDGPARALGAEVDALLRANASITRRIYYSAPSATDVAGKDFDVAGRLSAHELLALQAGPDAHYMLCGPASFLADIRSGLEAGGVAPERIHFESFGPSP